MIFSFLDVFFLKGPILGEYIEMILCVMMSLNVNLLKERMFVLLVVFLQESKDGE
jgi:hypothetical protein